MYAAETLYFADFSSTTTYYDNFRLSPDKTSEVEERLNAHLTLEKNLENIHNRVYFDLTQYLYLENNQSNNTAYRVGYDYEYLGQRNNFLASVAYSSDGSRNTQIADDNLIINPSDDYRKNTAFVNLGWSYDISERMNLVTQTSLDHTEYTINRQSDYDNYSLSSLLYYRLTPLLSVNGGIYTFYYAPKDSPIKNNSFFGGVLGLDYQINEKWAMGGNSSRGRTQTNFQDFEEIEKVEDIVSNSRLYQWFLTYTGERQGFNFDASRNEVPSSNGVLRLEERTGAAYNYSLSERQSITGLIYWRRSKQQFSFDDEATYYRGLSVAFSWALSEKLRSNIFYNYEHRKRSEGNAESNNIGIDFSYHWQ